MVTRFLASLRTDNSPQRKEAQPRSVSRSDIRLIQHLDSSALGLVRRWLLIGYFPIHLLPSLRRRLACQLTPRVPPEMLRHIRGEPLVDPPGGGARLSSVTACKLSATPHLRAQSHISLAPLTRKLRKCRAGGTKDHAQPTTSRTESRVGQRIR
jgi:hypothetical protein